MQSYGCIFYVIYINMKHVKLFEEFVLQDLENELGIELEVWNYDDYLELGKIIIPKSVRGQGVGTEAMERVIQYADKVGKDIRLTPSTDFGGTSRSRLERFYKQFGFQKNKDLKYKDTMVRYSNS